MKAFAALHLKMFGVALVPEAYDEADVRAVYDHLAPDVSRDPHEE